MTRLRLLYICSVISLMMINITAAKPSVIVILRNDDVHPGNNRQFDVQKRILAMAKEYGIPQTYAVVPGGYEKKELLDDKITSLIREASEEGLVEIALHGYLHRREQIHGLKSRLLQLTSEFCGGSYQQQKAKLSKGKQLLEANLGCAVYTFIPPWDTYDSTTIEAARDIGIHCISSSYAYYSTGSYKLPPPHPLSYLHCDASLGEFTQVLRFAKKRQEEISFITVGYHWWGLPNDLNPLKKVMATIASEPNVKAMTMKETVQTFHDVIQRRNEAKYRSVYLMRHASILLQLPILSKISEAIKANDKLEIRGLWEVSYYERGKKLAICVICVIYFVAAALAAGIAFLLSVPVTPKRFRKGKAALVSLGAVLIFLFLLAEGYFSLFLGHPGYSIKDGFLLYCVGFFVLSLALGIWRNFHSFEKVGE